MSQIPKTERTVLFVALGLMSIFLAAIVYSVSKLGLTVPSCISGVKPFDRGEVIEKGNGQYEIHYLAKMWAFEPEVVELPLGAKVDIYLSSKDVTHGFNIHGTNVNLMAVPGAMNYAQVTFSKPGEYLIVCHEYCGSGHQNMGASIRVLPEGQAPKPIVPLAVEEHKGLQAIKKYGCIACHTIDGAPGGVGPTYKGMYGRTETFTDGTTGVVDEAWIRTSIVKPNAKVIQGYNPVMPALPVTEPEIADIVEYLKTLK